MADNIVHLTVIAFSSLNIDSPRVSPLSDLESATQPGEAIIELAKSPSMVVKCIVSTNYVGPLNPSHSSQGSLSTAVMCCISLVWCSPGLYSVWR